ncbi:MAG: hypothetical protein U0S49_11885 [Rhodospirillales bacterium]|nr:hypothetical protein [Rhodospirillales bacterium]
MALGSKIKPRAVFDYVSGCDGSGAPRLRVLVATASTALWHAAAAARSQRPRAVSRNQTEDSPETKTRKAVASPRMTA